MRLIDADAIAPKLEGKFNQDYVRYAPTIDAVPVVRCKDCKHSIDSLWCTEKPCLCTRSLHGGNHKPDHFCSYGERRSDD